MKHAEAVWENLILSRKSWMDSRCHMISVSPWGRACADRIRQALQQGGHDVLIEDTRCDNGYSLSLVEKDGERTFISIDGIETKWQDVWLANLDATRYDYIYASGYGFQDGDTSGDVIMRFLRRKKPDCRLVLDLGPRLLGKQCQLPATEVASLRESFDTSICLDRPGLLHSQSCEVQQRSGNYQSH